MTAVSELARLSGTYFIDCVFEKSTSGAGHQVIDPATEEVIGEIADCSGEEVDRVIAVANRAQAAWAAQTGLARAAPSMKSDPLSFENSLNAFMSVTP